MQQLIDLNWGGHNQWYTASPHGTYFYVKARRSAASPEMQLSMPKYTCKIASFTCFNIFTFLLKRPPTKTVYGSRPWKNYASGLKQLEVNQTQCIICFQSLT